MPNEPTTNPKSLNILTNRSVRKYNSPELIRRILWLFADTLFRFSPRPCFAWRSWLLRVFGARVGRDVHVYPSTRIYYPWMLEIGDESAIGEDALIYNLGKITIGKQVTISHKAHLCAGSHDYTDPTLPLLRPSINVEDQVWICAEAFVGPSVTVRVGAVVGARAVVVKDVEKWSVVAGNPAKKIKHRVLQDYS